MKPLSKMKRAEVEVEARKLGVENIHQYTLPYLRQVVKALREREARS